LPVWNAVNDAGLGCNCDIIPDVDMADNANLACYHTMMSEGCRAGNTYLSNEQTIWAYLGAVSNRYQVAQLTALAYNGITERASFDSTTGADFYIVFYNHPANLRYLVMYAFVAGVAKAVFADRRIRIYDHTAAYLASVIHGNVRVYYTVIADFYALPDVHTGVDYAAVSDFCLIGNYYKIVNMAVYSNFCAI
jgi:hypothetical protein